MADKVLGWALPGELHISQHGEKLASETWHCCAMGWVAFALGLTLDMLGEC